MRRAVVWLCWGAPFVASAIESALSGASLGLDRILITDTAGAAQAADADVFTAIIPATFPHGNNLDKSALIDLIPEGYDTFLFLDCDTRVIGDLSLGFEKAERHGIAIAPAPNYNLPEFFGCAPLMRQAGLEPADQIQYNAGVIFFHLTPAVRQVLRLWRELCDTIGADAGFPRDQPFLNMAFEKLGFLPYVLSPLYNYRGMGEHAVGAVRIWHSHDPVPADLNDFETAWPARRYLNGIRIDVVGGEHRATDPPLPQPMLRLKPPPNRRPLSSPQADAIARAAMTIRDEQGARLALQYLLDDFGVDVSADHGEGYFSEALEYHLGLLFAYSLEPERMAGHIQRSHTMPGPYDDQIFSDHVHVSQATDAHRRRGVARGVPPLLFSCMPRSASASMTHILAGLLDIPVLHLSLGQFPNQFLAPSWLDMFLEGGAITQDHFSPNDFNVGVLSARGARDVFVLIRDPRAAARSNVRFFAASSGGADMTFEARIERECVDHFVPWLQGWIDCANNPETPFRVRWLTYAQVAADPAAVVREVVRILSPQHPSLAPYADCQEVENTRIHYVDGDDDAWRAEVGKTTRHRLWAACTPDIKALLALAP